MPDSERRRHDEWTCLETPSAAAAAIAKLETMGRSPAEVEARDCYLDLLDLRPGNTVLDVGAGRTAIEMARRVGARQGSCARSFSPYRRVRARGRDAVRRRRHSGLAGGACRDAAVPEVRSTAASAVGSSACRCRGDSRERNAAGGPPGGRIMCVEADWETVTVFPGERRLTRSILNFSSDRHIEGWSGRRLAPLLRGCGLVGVCVHRLSPSMTLPVDWSG